MTTLRTATSAGLALALSVVPVAAQDSEAPGPPVVETLQLTWDAGTKPYRLSFTPSRGTESSLVGPEWQPRLASTSETSPTASLASAAARRSFRARTTSTQTTEPATWSKEWIKRHPAKFGALLGAATGAVVGILTLATLDCPPTQSCSTAGAVLLSYPLFGAGGGALIGWAIGPKK